MEAKLEWDANTEVDLSRYKVYAGRASGVYNLSFTTVYTGIGEEEPVVVVSANPEIPAGVSAIQVFLPDGILVYIAVTALDLSDNESAKSTELTKINKYTQFRV